MHASLGVAAVWPVIMVGSSPPGRQAHRALSRRNVRLLDAVGLGNPCVDLLLNLPRLPEPDESMAVNALSWQGGGKVPTALVALSRLGAKAGVIAAIGDDALGRFIIEDFRRHGVDTSGVVTRDGEHSAFSVVLSDLATRSRSILWNPGTVAPLSAEEVDNAYLLGSRMILLSGAGPLEFAAAEAARRSGVMILMDADHFDGGLLEIAPLVDYFIASEDFAREWMPSRSPETVLNAIAGLGPQVSVITLGSRGCAMHTNGTITHCPACDVEAVDTTGAGDVFHGAFAFGVLKRWSPEYCCRFANAVSGIKCTRIGGRAGIPTREETERFMRTGYIELADADELCRLYSRAPGDSTMPPSQHVRPVSLAKDF